MHRVFVFASHFSGSAVCLQGDVMLKKLLNLLASYSKLQFVDPSQPRLLPRCMFVSRIVRGDHTLTVCFCPCVSVGCWSYFNDFHDMAKGL